MIQTWKKIAINLSHLAPPLSSEMYGRISPIPPHLALVAGQRILSTVRLVFKENKV